MPRKLLIAVLVLALAPPLAFAADVPRFRGPQADGIYAETGLLQTWPEGGPRLKWRLDGLGETYASMTVVDGRIYTTGLADGRGSVFALSTGGEVLWRQDYGEEFDGRGYPGTRNTPTVYRGKLFLLSSLGKAVSLDAMTGAIRWERDLLGDFGGENTYFGMAEQPLIVDGQVIYTPGGADASLAAFDPDTGETLWTTTGLSENAAYCSARLFETGGHRQIVTAVATKLAGVDPGSGEVLWTHPVEVEYNIQANSPAFIGDRIYLSHGYGQGGRLVQLAADGRSVEEKWTEPDIDVHHGGMVVLDGRIYGAADNGTWAILDAESGEIVASARRRGKGSIVYADGRLYGYTEKGEVLLVDPDPESFEVVGSFEITEGDGNHWSHPVVANGTLYVRHGDVLMAYDVRDPAKVRAAFPPCLGG